MIQMPASQLKKSFLVNLDNIVGPEGYSLRDTDRLSYSRDANFRSAISAHYSHFENFPSVVTWPKSAEEVAQLIKAAIKYRLAITPYGGGSGVCGGAIAYDGGMILDMKKMQKVLRVDEERLFIEAEAGILGWQLENELARRGYTLGHFPTSILCATLGGYLAARSAGQLSSKYGKIEDLVIDVEFVDGTGAIHRTADVSRSRGVDFTQCIVGSEGTLGLITKARLKLYPLPEQRLFRAVSFPTMAYGMEGLRRIMQTGIKPDVLRLYDELDSAIMISRKSQNVLGLQDEEAGLSMPAPLKDALALLKSKALKLAFHGHRLIHESVKLSWFGCALIIMLEGDPKLTLRQMQIILGIARDMDGKDLGEDPATHWYRHRYSVSYKAPKLFTDGAFTDTMEVATTWDNLAALYEGIRSALKPYCLVLAHVSHVYPEGAAIYFTFVAPLTGLKGSLKSYDRIWQKGLSTTQKFGGVISHHHGIGRLKSSHLREEWGEARELYLKLKGFFDPHQILNPEVLMKS